MKKSKNYLSLAVAASALCFVLTGCGNNKTTSTSGNNKNTATTESLANDTGNAVGNAANDTGNAVGDVANGVGNAVGDVANGVGNAVNDLVGNNGFTNYNDAHDYFLDTMGAYHSDAKFEIRNEDQNLNDYQEGSKGYHFHLYDTSNNKNGELFGEFFVDANNGAIYKKDSNGKITEYPANNTHTSNNTNQRTVNQGTANNTSNYNATTNNTTTTENHNAVIGNNAQ